jgi:hypothetical protein
MMVPFLSGDKDTSVTTQEKRPQTGRSLILTQEVESLETVKKQNKSQCHRTFLLPHPPPCPKTHLLTFSGQLICRGSWQLAGPGLAGLNHQDQVDVDMDVQPCLSSRQSGSGSGLSLSPVLGTPRVPDKCLQSKRCSGTMQW